MTMDQVLDQPHERIFTILFNEEELTWQNIIYDLVHQEGMNPWDIDITKISKKFLERIRALTQLDFRITGKMVLASALLLKLKSNQFFNEDMTVFDQLLSDDDAPLDDLEPGQFYHDEDLDITLFPKTPQPRKRKVSVFDLVKALEHALQVEARRKPVTPRKYEKVEIPEIQVDLDGIMSKLYVRIEKHYAKDQGTLSFDQLCPGDTKIDKVLTFVPLLHLENQQKVDMNQKEHFGEILIHLAG